MKNRETLLKIITILTILITYAYTLSPKIETSIEKAILTQIHGSHQPIRNQSTEIKGSLEAPQYITSGLHLEKPKEYYISSTSFAVTDPRIVAMRKFLLDYNSPMYPYADVFVTEADKYGLDWRLVASISGVESAFGNMTPYQSNNAWGWRGGPGGDWSRWPSWKEGIETVTRGLAQGYGTHLTPFQIESTYCPPCGRDPNHPWAWGVHNYMNELDHYVERL